MKKVILVRFGELFLKGKNKKIFEKMLLNNIKDKLNGFNLVTQKIGGRYLISEYSENDEIKIIKELQKVFGVHSISPAVMIETSVSGIEDYVSTIRLSTKSFRVTVNRADKTFPINSTNFSAKLGGIVLENNDIVVDLHNPTTTINVDIRERNQTFIFYDLYEGERGMPLGSSSKGLLLLSGGIDSPVAGYMIAKRGMPIDAIHFHSYPYTSEMAKEKVIKLANILSDYVGNFKMYIVSFTKIQEAINKCCAPEFMITIMRRIMMKISEKIAKDNNLKAIITGESLGQVASQTIESITVSNIVMKETPILRPLIAMDKEDITQIARKINTFQTSILPYEDCCTVFLPKHPLIKPHLDKVLREEEKLDIEALIDNALSTLEVVEIGK